MQSRVCTGGCGGKGLADLVGNRGHKFSHRGQACHMCQLCLGTQQRFLYVAEPLTFWKLNFTSMQTVSCIIERARLVQRDHNLVRRVSQRDCLLLPIRRENQCA